MRTDPRSMSGQALTELLVGLIALLPLYWGIAWVAKVIDVGQVTVQASRGLAFQCALLGTGCLSRLASPGAIDSLRSVYFPNAEGRFGPFVRADRMAGVNPANGFWTDRLGATLVERDEDMRLRLGQQRFSSPLAFASGQSAGQGTSSAASRLSDAAGPGRFGLDIEGGLFRAEVQVNVGRGRSAQEWLRRMTAMPLTVRGQLAILADPWRASGPYGSAADTVQTRVTAGARVPLIESGLGIGWLPVRALVGIADAIGFENSAASLRWHVIDVDRVPSDRIANQAQAVRGLRLTNQVSP